MIAAALSALLLSATPRLEAAVTAGGGYDSNLNHADPTVSAVGSGYGAVRASGGASLDLGDATNLYLGARFDGEGYPSYADLSNGAVAAELSLVQDLGERTALVVTPWAAKSWAGDTARNATTLAGQVTLRVKPVRDLALRAFYAYSSRTADDAVFSSNRNRGGASAEWQLVPRTYLSVAGSVERGYEVFYRLDGGGGGGYGMGRMSETFGRSQVAYRATATTWAVAPALELGLDRTWHLVATWETRFLKSSAANLTTNTLFLGIGARL